MDKSSSRCADASDSRDSSDGDNIPSKKGLKRDQWSSNFDFFISICSGSVGLGNVWRFPYLCYINGGGAFLLPYFVCLIIGGLPIFFLEVSIGQFMGAGAMNAWAVCPLMQGIGAASTIIMILINLYYNVILAWTVMYLFASFTSVLPWSHCNNYWNTEKCFVYQGSTNIADRNETSYDFENNTIGSLSTNLSSQQYFNNSFHVSSVKEFWERRVLRLSDGIEDVGIVQWDLALCLLLCWIIVFFCISKGIKTAGKVTYVTSTFPFVLLCILLIRGATLPGALEGVKFYLVPDFKKILNLKVWADAGSQVFFSYALCNGTISAMGSYNKRNHNCYRDSILFCFVNSGTSILSGFVIFTTLGFMAGQQGKTVAEVAESGPGLAFIAYPQAVSEMPLSPLWAILFFLMVFLLGMGSIIINCESVATAVFDRFPHAFHTRHRRLWFNIIRCGLSFLVGLLMVTSGGMYVFQLFDFFGGSRVITLVGFLECTTIAYLYGVKRYYKDLSLMLGYEIGPFMKVSWLVLSPLYTMATFILCILAYTEVVYNRTYHYPTWSIVCGWICGIMPLAPIPIVAAMNIMKAEGQFLLEKVKGAMEPKLPIRLDHIELPGCDQKKTELTASPLLQNNDSKV